MTKEIHSEICNKLKKNETMTIGVDLLQILATNKFTKLSDLCPASLQKPSIPQLKCRWTEGCYTTDRDEEFDR